MLLRLCWLIVGLSTLTAAAGVLWPADGAPFTFTTLRGTRVEIFGQGLYRYDTVFTATGNRGTDAATLLLGVPLLILSILRHRRGLLRGRLLLLGTLAYFLYVYASYALGAVAYNALFLAYVVLFSATLYAFVLAFAAVDPRELGASLRAGAPRRGLAAFLLASGAVTLVAWVGPVVSGLLGGVPPARLDSYSTPVTFALDLATITPASVLAGAWVWRGDPRGYRLALSLLVLEAMLAPLIGLQTASQLRAGVSFAPGEIIGPMAGFLVLAGMAVWMLVDILRHVREPAGSEQA